MSQEKFDTDERTRLRMQQVRVANTSIEKMVRSVLHSMGYRFTLRRRDLPGKPDVVMPKYKTIVFVHGCFWHGHAICRKGTLRPKRNAELWEQKILKNIAKDERVTQELKTLGWRVITVWECETKDRTYLAEQLTNRLSREEGGTE